MVAKIIDGRWIAKEIREQVAKEVDELKKEHHFVPNIATIRVGKKPESDLYLRLRDKACEEVGIFSCHVDLAVTSSEKEVIDAIKQLNKDDDVHGILIQLPLPKQVSFDKLISVVHPNKDVEGLHPENLGRTLLGDERIVPITPLSVLTILDYEKTKYESKDVVIVNHSNIVGKPLAALFLNRDCSVSVCHVFTKDLKSYTKNADIIITASGVPKLITKYHVKKGAFVLDVGIVKTKTGVCGDVDFESVKKVAGKITPVPGGVGPVTVACSLKNMLKTFGFCIKWQ
jgi:methylenetetrahydrofolate dehydrogenase (NADP+)/methenyltetrahydrofolate cyclohydrolase